MGRVINYSSNTGIFNLRCADMVLAIINFFAMTVTVKMQEQRNIHFNFKIESIHFDDDDMFDYVVLRNVERDGVGFFDDYLFGTSLTRLTDIYIYRRNDNSYEMWLDSRILNEAMMIEGRKKCDYNYYVIKYDNDDCATLFNQIIELINDKSIEPDDYRAKADDLYHTLADMLSLPKEILNAQSLCYNLLSIGLRPEEDVCASNTDSEE